MIGDISADEYIKQLFAFQSYLCMYSNEGIEFKTHIDNSFSVTKEIAQNSGKHLQLSVPEHTKNLLVATYSQELFDTLMERDAGYFNGEVGLVKAQFDVNTEVENEMIERFCLRRWKDEQQLYTEMDFVEAEINHLEKYHDKVRKSFQYQYYPILKFFKEAQTKQKINVTAPYVIHPVDLAYVCYFKIEANIMEQFGAGKGKKIADICAGRNSGFVKNFEIKYNLISNYKTGKAYREKGTPNNIQALTKVCDILKDSPEALKIASEALRIASNNQN
jgi:hypothetical protein